MSEAYAVVLTHLPDEGKTYHTPFWGKDHADPLAKAHAFAHSERARDDWPGALWVVTGNVEAVAQAQVNLLRSTMGRA